MPAGDAFGDERNRVRPSGSTRVVFQNINGVPELADSPKQHQLHQWLVNERVGIALLAETNRHWPSIPEGNRWPDRMRAVSSSGHYSSLAHNKHQTRTARVSAQYGGCLVSVFNDVAHSAKEYGNDPTGLGRWAYVRIRGKQFAPIGSCPEDSVPKFSKDLIIISAYRPNPPSPGGASTVWAQHKLYFQSIGRGATNPRQAFTSDLSKAITKWRDQGCEVILGLDANEDLSVTGGTSFRAKMAAVGLKEAIMERHPSSPQATFQRNSNSTPIDGIFTSGGVPVQAGGYYGFDEFAPSDHRALWIDFDLTQCLGGHTSSKSTFKPRRLVTTDSGAVRRYLDQVHQDYSTYNVPTRLSNIVQSLQDNEWTMTPRLQRKFNCLHEHIYTIRRRAEESCGKISKGKVPWSPAIQSLWDRLALWKILLKGRKRCRISSRKVRRLMKKTQLPDAWKLSTAELRLQLKKEWEKYKIAKPKAEDWRRDHLNIQVQAARKHKWRSKKARARFLRLRRMKQREETRRRRRARGKGYSGGLRAIQVEETLPDGTVHTKTITDQRLVEAGCRQENTARYDQTRAPFCTPPMQQPLYDTFTGAQREESLFALLEGRYEIPTSLDQPTQQFLSQCRFHEGYSPACMEVTPEDHRQFWTKNKENKGSEPHGLHNGHFKAALGSPLVSHCDSLFRSIPLKTGFVPDQWKNLMNFAIEKKPGDHRLSKMRTIQLMNSEFQANNKKMGKTAMAFAEEHNLIPAGQCGARKQHQAIDLALSKRLVWDLLLLQRRSAGWISNDAKSCFDRIVHWVAIVSLLRFGILYRVVSSAFDTLAQATHRVRTGFGDSEESFSPPSDVSFQGCGQGNGAGPAIWVAVSSVLISMMETAGLGFECLSAVDQQLVVAQCFAFIDDTDVTEAAKSVDSSGADICHLVQKAATLWSGGIRATGGSINPEKSFWWLLDFAFDHRAGRWKFLSKTDKLAAPNFTLQIQGLSGELEALDRLEPNHSKRTLGVMMAPQENQKAQITHLTAIAKDWAENLRPHHLLRQDVLPLIKTTLLKSLAYPMPLTTFDQETWRRIMSPVLAVCLPKAGVCRTFPQSCVYAPLSLQGLGLPHPFGSQVQSHIEMLLRHPANRTKTATYLEAVVQAHQLETGTSYGLLQQDYSNTAILTSDTWLKRVWQELESVSAYVAFDSPALELHRAGDSLLIDLFMELGVNQETLLWLNWCRVHLHVTTVSDVVTADGKHIRRAIWQGLRSPATRSSYQWPRTVNLGPKHWDSWRLHLSQALLSSHGVHLLLTRPLGPWTDNLLLWNWRFSPTHGLFLRHGAIWQHFPLPESSTRQQRFLSSDGSTWRHPLPLDAHRATVFRPTADVILLDGVDIGEPPPTSLPEQPASPSVINSWQRMADQCDDYFGWVPDELEIHGQEWELASALAGNRLRFVCDGSFSEHVGTAAIQLLSYDCKSRIIIRCQVPGRVDDQSPYRSELVGIMVGIMVVDWLLLEWANKIPVAPSVHLACDGKAALDQCFSNDTLSPTSPQFDVISTIRAMLHKSAVTFHPHHVLGHQDKKVKRPLTWWEERNLEVDTWAVAYRLQLPEYLALDPPNPRFFLEPSSLFLDGIKQSHLAGETIQELVALPLLRERWLDQGTISAEAEKEIDWSTVRRSMHAMPAFLQRWTTKHSAGICGVGKFLCKWGNEPHDECPLCGKKEDHLHVPRCVDARATTEWNLLYQSMASWLDANDTGAAIKQGILHVLRAIRFPDQQAFQSLSPRMRAAMASQLLIGPQGLLEGRLSVLWRPLQHQYYKTIGSRRSAHLWASRLAQQLILIGHKMWSHRNSIKHSDDSVQARRDHRRLDSGILSEFEMGTDDLPRDIKPMLAGAGTAAALLRSSLQRKKDWLLLVSQARRDRRRALAPRIKMIRSLFAVPPST